MMRLTKAIREDILDTLIKRRFEESLAALEAEHQKFAEDYYDALFSKEERELLDSCPIEWFYQDSDITATYQGRNISLKMASSKRMPRNVSYEELSPIFAKRWSKLIAKKDELQKLKYKTRQEASSVLHSVTTAKALIAAWPEVEPFVPDAAKPPAAITALAIPIKSLNRSLGLP